MACRCKRFGIERHPFVGINAKDWVYVEPQGESPQFYGKTGETEDIIGTLSKDERAAYSAWVAELRHCAGLACEVAPDALFIN
jgi:hypothetical protein